MGAKFNASLMLMMRVEDTHGVSEKRIGKAARWLATVHGALLVRYGAAWSRHLPGPV